jgi:hypothetical protein
MNFRHFFTLSCNLDGKNAGPLETMAINFTATVPLQTGGSAAPKFPVVAVTQN